MSGTTPVRGPGTWYRNGPATLVRRGDGFVVLVPGVRKEVIEAAWEALAEPPRGEDFVSRLVEGAGLESASQLKAVLFGALGPDRVLVGVKGSSPLAVYTGQERTLVAGSEEEPIAVREVPGALRVAFGELPAEEGPGGLRVVSGIVGVRGFLHMTCDPAGLDEGAATRLRELVAEDDGSIEDPAARAERAPGAAGRRSGDGQVKVMRPVMPTKPAPVAPAPRAASLRATSPRAAGATDGASSGATGRATAAAPGGTTAASAEPEAPNVFADLFGAARGPSTKAAVSPPTVPGGSSAAAPVPEPVPEPEPVHEPEAAPEIDPAPPATGATGPGTAPDRSVERDPSTASSPRPATGRHRAETPRPAPDRAEAPTTEPARRRLLRTSLFDRAGSQGALASDRTSRPAAASAPAPAPDTSALRPELEATQDPAMLEDEPSSPDAPSPASRRAPSTSDRLRAEDDEDRSRPAEDVGPYDELFGDTVHRRIEDAAVRAGGEDEPATPAAPDPPSPETATEPPPTEAGQAPADADGAAAAPVGEFIDWVPGVGRAPGTLAPASASGRPRRPESLTAAAPPPVPVAAPAREPAPAQEPALAREPAPAQEPALAREPAPAQEPSPDPDPVAVPSPAPSGVESPRPQHRTAPRHVPTISALVCPAGHANPPETDRCRHCEAPLEGPVRTVPRPERGALEISTGGRVVLDRGVVIGRKPRASRVSGDDVPQLITVPSPQHDISRSHLAVLLEGWHVLVEDLETTNGTLLMREGEPPARLHPRRQVLLRDGDVLDLGDGVTLRWREDG